MEEIQDLLKENPGSESVNLEFLEIETLDPLIPFLLKFKNLKELNLFGNKLSYLPESLGKLKLRSLDIANNLFEDIEDVAKGLKGLANLERLHLSFANDIDMNNLLDIVPKLKYLNDNYVGKEEDYSIKQEDLEKIALVYDEIRAVSRGLDESRDKQLAEYFDENIKVIMGELSEVAKSRCPGTVLNAYMLKAKHSLNFMCLDKVVEYSKIKTPETSPIFEGVINELKAIHEALLKMIMSSLENNMNLVQELKKKRANLLHPKELLKLKEAISDKSELLELAYKEKEELLEEIASLQEENKKYLDTIIKRTKNSADISQKAQSVQTVLSKQETKELITFIYTSKSKLDISQNEGARQTLTQHMFQCLAEKFKSRARSVQKASDLVSSLPKYIDDVDVLLFAKVLKNDCDENYRFLHEQIKETITEMVKEHTKTEEIKSKNWMEIVRFVYDSKDSEEMLKFIPLSKRSKPSMSTAEFVNYILQFQLKSHEKYISKFNALFKGIDRDQDGVISDEEFFKLCDSFELDINGKDIAKFLDLVDPNNSGKVVYSDCVGVFSTELVPGKSNPILQELT